MGTVHAQDGMKMATVFLRLVCCVSVCSINHIHTKCRCVLFLLIQSMHAVHTDTMGYVMVSRGGGGRRKSQHLILVILCMHYSEIADLLLVLTYLINIHIRINQENLRTTITGKPTVQYFD